jgi:hypothetical protein
MRKRIVSARVRTVTTAFSLVLLAAACDSTSDTPESASVGSIGGGMTAATDAAVGNQASNAVAQREELMVRRQARATAAAAPPPPPVEVSAASAVGSGTAGDTRGITLGTPLPASDPSGAMLIRNGRATVEVRRVDDAVTRLRQTATQLGGFVANTAILGGKDEHRSATLEIRVPSTQFDAAVSALASLGKVESVSASVQDVGDEYVDLGARVANARHMEARLVEMLARRTGNLSQALTVEQELRRVREEIERYDARLKWLERRTSLSSIEITLREPMSVLDPRGPSPIAEAFGEAWRRAVAVLAWGIAALGVLIPLALLIGLGVLIYRRTPKLKGGLKTVNGEP